MKPKKNAEKKWPRPCEHPRCRTLVSKKAKCRLCPKHNSRRWKERYPLSYSFNALRNRARQRGHEFLLTFEQYVGFAQTTGYAELKGKTAMSLSIHRRDERGPYHIDNITAVSLAENSRQKYNPYLARMEKLAIAAAEAEVEEGDPF